MHAATLPSRVTAVTVFRRGALVTRTATLVRGDEGFPTAVRLEGLPLLLEDESLQVELQVEAGEDPRAHGQPQGPVPLAGELRVTLAVPEPDEQLRPPTNEELRAAALELALAQQAQADLELVAACVSSLAPGARGAPEEGKPPMPSPTEARLALLALRRERLGHMEAPLAEAAERTRVATERLGTLRERERRASQAKNPRTFEARKAVVVGLLPVPTGEPPGQRVRLQLRYFVPGARWAPSYVLRLDPSLGSGTLELRALVGQRTGERWTDVALTLSTAHPQQWTELPELRSLRIGRAQPPPPKAGWRPPPSGTERLYDDYDRAAPPKVPAVPMPPVPAVPMPASLGAPPPPLPRARSQSREEARSYGGAMDADELEQLAEEASTAFALPEPQADMARRSVPPPAPGSPPMAATRGGMPMPMAASAPARSKGGLGGMIGGALDGLFSGSGGGGVMPPASMAPPMEGYDEPENAPAAGPLLAGREQLEYGSLWLPPPDDPRRGHLQRADRAQRYGRLAELPPEQVAAALSRAEAARVQAQQLEERSPPSGHRWAQGSEGFDYAYQAQAHVDLDSDGELHGLPLSASPLETTPRYIAVPRETQDVFRVVVLRNPLDAPLLPGPVDVYLGGRFALASELQVTPPRGRVELGLGVEQALKIARNVTFEEESSGLLKRQRDLEHRVRVEFKSHLPTAATVEVRERLPVTRDGEDDIEVLERSIDPAWDEHEQPDPPLRGGRAWTVEVPAGGERTLRASYTIRIPKDHELVGGNRREG